MAYKTDGEIMDDQSYTDGTQVHKEVTSLPTASDQPEGQIVKKDDGLLYRNTGTSWELVKTTPNVDYTKEFRFSGVDKKTTSTHSIYTIIDLTGIKTIDFYVRSVNSDWTSKVYINGTEKISITDQDLTLFNIDVSGYTGETEIEFEANYTSDIDEPLVLEDNYTFDSTNNHYGSIWNFSRDGNERCSLFAIWDIK